MHIEVTPKEDWHIRIKDNGKVVLDKVLEAGVAHVVDTDPPECGYTQAFLVEGDDEMLIATGGYYGDCKCEDGPHTPPEV